MARTVNAETISHVKRWEGCKLKAYPDPGSRDGNPWTIGYGHTSDSFLYVTKGLTITQAQADAALEHDLNETAAAIAGLVKVPLNDNQFGALVSFAFNVGVGAFKGSTLLKKLNAGDYASVPAQLARWNKNDGKVMDGLTNRRAAEAGLWAKGAFVASNTVPAATGSGIADLMKPETLTAGAGLLSGSAALATGNGPVQIAFAVGLVLAFAVGAFLVIRKATR